MRCASRLLSPSLIGLCFLAACSGGGIPRHDSQQQLRDRYANYAGPPLDGFTYLGRYDSWESIGNNQLVVFTTPFDAYLVTVQGPCSDLNFVNTIGLTSTGNTVSSRLDSVKVKRQLCPISEIRRVDYQKMKADMRVEADKAKADAAATKSP